MPETSRSPEVRHRRADRLFHWVMALAVIVLGVTAFLPLIGIGFEWVPLHWMAGVVLTLAVSFHLYRVFVVHGLREMIPDMDDVREVSRSVRGAGQEGLSAAKYDAFQKGYHAAAAITVLVLLVTGLLMLVKIDTTFWRRDPAILSDQDWGLVYVLHGGAALILLFLFLVHVYFALLPEHRVFLLSMLRNRGPEKSRMGKA